MRTYLRMLRHIRPYLPQVVVSVLFTVVFSVLSSVSIMMIAPFLRTLFHEGAEARPALEATAALAPGTPAAGEASVAGERPGSAAGGVIRDDAAGPLPVQVSRLDRLKDQALRRLDAYLLRGTKSEAIWRICVVFFCIYLVKNIAGYFATVLITWVGQRVIKDLRDALFIRLTSLPLGFYHRHRAGELISRVTNDVQIANMCVNVSFTNLVRDPILIVTFLGMALLISWKLTLIASAVLPLSMLVIVRIGKKLRKYSHRQQERLADLTSVLQETVYGIRVVKAFAMERFANRRFLEESGRLFRDLFKIARTQRLSSPLSEQLSVIVGLFILWYGGNQVLDGGDISPELFILFFICIFSLVHPIKELSQVNNGIQEGMAAAERIFAVLDAEPEALEDDGAATAAAEPIRGRVEFRNVTFAYESGKPVLRDVSLTVEPGEVVALVGASGAGKSTLVDLIPRFYDPQQGEILIDGRDIRSLGLSPLRRAMGIVTQEVILFNDTVRANIAYGAADVPRERIEAAARAANAHEFIAALPDGYDTPIGDRGVKLSGGQRQRLSIARAILKDPPILIFDEATSALDTEAEQVVQEAIDRLVRQRTTFVIAHRLSTIQNVDRIHVLDAGRIVETGTHAELLAAGGLYRDLYQLQFRA